MKSFNLPTIFLKTLQSRRLQLPTGLSEGATENFISNVKCKSEKFSLQLINVKTALATSSKTPECTITNKQFPFMSSLL